MLKFVLILSVAVALVLLPMHETEAFKVITIHPGSAPAAASGSDAAPALDPAALLQGVQKAIASKLQEIQGLVGSLVQQKTALKQNALNSLQTTLGSVKAQVQALAGQLRPPVLVHKHIYLGGAAPAAAPDATTTADDDDEATTE